MLNRTHSEAPTDSTLKFFLLTLALTWGYSAMLRFANTPSSDLSPSLPRFLLGLLGAFAPSLVALGLTAHEAGLTGVKALLRRLLIWRVDLRWYAFALLFMAAIAIAFSIAYRAVVQQPYPWRSTEWTTLVSSFVLNLPVRVSEEIGWRGYALPRLMKRFGFRWASLILGPVWAFWHLPLFLTPAIPSAYRQSFPLFVLEVTAISVVFAWLYVNTRGSLLLMTLLHSAINATLLTMPLPTQLTSPLALPSEIGPWLAIGLLCITAGYLLLQMPAGNSGTFTK